MVLFLSRSFKYLAPKACIPGSASADSGSGKSWMSNGFKSRTFEVTVYHHQNTSLLRAAITGLTCSFFLKVNQVSRLLWPFFPFKLNAGAKSVKTFQYSPPVVR